MTTIRQPWEWWRWNIVIDDNRSFCIHNWSAIPCLYSSASCTLDRDSGVREMRSGGVEWRNYDFIRTSNHKTVLDSCDFMVKTTFFVGSYAISSQTHYTRPAAAIARFIWVHLIYLKLALCSFTIQFRSLIVLININWAQKWRDATTRESARCRYGTVNRSTAVCSKRAAAAAASSTSISSWLEGGWKNEREKKTRRKLWFIDKFTRFQFCAHWHLRLLGLPLWLSMMLILRQLQFGASTTTTTLDAQNGNRTIECVYRVCFH